MDLGLKGQTVLVTGSSSGIGRATAVAFGEEGARVAVTYLSNPRGGEETARQVRSAGGETLVLPYDLAAPDTIRAAVATIEREWGTLNVLVNNAAPMDLSAPTGQPFEDVPPERWEGMLRGALEGVVVTLRYTVPLMRRSGWGRIVTLSSDAVDGWPGLGPYATAKAGLHGLSRTLAVELGPVNILSNVVMPGMVLTEDIQERVPEEYKEQVRQHTATRRLTTPEDVARLVVFLGSQANQQITGEIVRITGIR
jgi:3-oxoacyl-[acyl-carrier protein] reductase